MGSISRLTGNILLLQCKILLGPRKSLSYAITRTDAEYDSLSNPFYLTCEYEAVDVFLSHPPHPPSTIPALLLLSPVTITIHYLSRKRVMADPNHPLQPEAAPGVPQPAAEPPANEVAAEEEFVNPNLPDDINANSRGEYIAIDDPVHLQIEAYAIDAHYFWGKGAKSIMVGRWSTENPNQYDWFIDYFMTRVQLNKHKHTQAACGRSWVTKFRQYVKISNLDAIRIPEQAICERPTDNDFMATPGARIVNHKTIDIKLLPQLGGTYVQFMQAKDPYDTFFARVGSCHPPVNRHNPAFQNGVPADFYLAPVGVPPQ